MKALLFSLGLAVSLPVLAKSIQCELMRNEILLMHQQLTQNPCEAQYQWCLRSAGGDPMAAVSNQIVKTGCSMQGNIDQAFNNRIAIFQQRLEQYKQMCER